jgi:hypothetical protein
MVLHLSATTILFVFHGVSSEPDYKSACLSQRQISQGLLMPQNQQSLKRSRLLHQWTEPTAAFNFGTNSPLSELALLNN